MDRYEQALVIMAATPAQLRAIVSTMDRDSLNQRPRPERWSIREVLVHLWNAETAGIGERVRRMVTEEQPLLAHLTPGVAPDDPKEILDQWTKAREDHLRYLRTLTPEQRQRTGRHAKYGQVSIQEHVVEWAYHDLDHLRQILAVWQVELYPAIGAFQAQYPQPT